jgi:hypothetical protein
MAMPFRDLPKSIRRSIRDLAAIAHERELAAALRQLDELFSQWRSGQLNPHSLNDAIHQFHDGASRDLWKLYTDSDPSVAVASAIARGVLLEREIPSQTAGALQSMVASLSDRSEEPDEE